MIPIASFLDMLKQKEFFNEKDRIYAFFLYTDEDITIAKYVRKHFPELNSLSGHKCLVFYIESPHSRETRLHMSREDIMDYDKFHPTLPRSHSKTRPYDRSEVYVVARRLSIPLNQIPCLIFFQDIESDKILVYPLDTEWTSSKLTANFRKIFSAIEKSGGIMENGRGRRIWRELVGNVEDKSNLLPEAFLVYLGITLGGLIRGLASF